MTFYPVGVFYIFLTQFIVYVENLESVDSLLIALMIWAFLVLYSISLNIFGKFLLVLVKVDTLSPVIILSSYSFFMSSILMS